MTQREFAARRRGRRAVSQCCRIDALEARRLFSVALVKDINATGASSEPGSFVEFNGALYFTADDGEHGRELWRSDGTAAGTAMVLDLNPGTASGIGSGLCVSNGKLFFVGNDGVHGFELFKSDGTAGGTTLIEDITPGPNGSAGLFTPVDVNGKVFFSANDGPHGMEMWVSNGTAAGTFLLKDIAPGSVWSFNTGSVSVGQLNGEFFFAASTGAGGAARLWKSNGTTTGTVRIDAAAVTGAPTSPQRFTNVGSHLFFYGSSANSGRELWKTDGTAAGTQQIKEIGFGTDSGIPADPTRQRWAVVGDTYYFAADDGSGVDLWKSDGTDAGTQFVKDLNPTGHDMLYDMTAYNDTLYFAAGVGSGSSAPTGLWTSDGTDAGTQEIKGGISLPASFTIVNGTLFFTATDGTSDGALWKSDGTAAGTVMVKAVPALHDSISGREPNSLFAFGETLYFNGLSPEHGRELWTSDGTSAGTNLFKDINTQVAPDDGRPQHVRVVNDVMVFVANDGINGSELWRSDGSSDGTMLLKDIKSVGGSGPQGLTGFNNLVYFTADDGIHGRELWRTDGTADGTFMAADMTPGPASSPQFQNFVVAHDALYFNNGSNFCRVDAAGNVAVLKSGGGGSSIAYAGANGLVYFYSTTSTTGSEPWRTDGTPGATLPLGDLNPGATNHSSTTVGFHAVNNRTLFAAESPSGNVELWSTDGTPGGTGIVREINPGGSSFISGGAFVHDNVLYFGASDGVNGKELWRSDGTAGGTQMVKDLAGGSGFSSPTNFTLYNGAILFTANDSAGKQVLWTTDGTTEGTAILKSLGGSPSQQPRYTIMDGTLYFFASTPFVPADPDSGGKTTLWKTDGTPAGTVPVVILQTEGYSIDNVMAANNRLYFAVHSYETGDELWRSAGTADSTEMIDLYPGTLGAMPAAFTNYQNQFFFTARTPDVGEELRTINPGFIAGADSQFAISGAYGAETLTIASGDVHFTQDAASEYPNLSIVVTPDAGEVAASVRFSAAQNLKALTLNGNAEAVAMLDAGLVRLEELTLNDTSRFNLSNNTMLLDYDAAAEASPIGSWDGSAYTGVTGMIARGYNFSEWDGPGLVTTTPLARSALATLGTHEAGVLLGIDGNATDVWNGHTVDGSTLIMKYTYASDADVNGYIDAVDYGTIDQWIQFPGTNGFANGDFNFDGVIDAVDYGIIDNTIQLQGPPL